MKNTRRTQRISKQAHNQRFIVILFQRSSIHSSAKLNDILCSYQNHITTIPINKYFKEIESENHSFVIIENCTTHSSIQIRICETISLVWIYFKTRNLVTHSCCCKTPLLLLLLLLLLGLALTNTSVKPLPFFPFHLLVFTPREFLMEI